LIGEDNQIGDDYSSRIYKAAQVLEEIA